MHNKEEYSTEQIKNFQRWWQQHSKKIEIDDVSGPIRVAPPREESIPRFPPGIWPVAKEDLLKNLEKYKKLALDLGAVDAKIVPAKDIPQDVRSLHIGCLNPRCRWLNTNFHCPMVRTFLFEEMKEFFADYDNAIVFKTLPPTMNNVPEVGRIDLDLYYTIGGGKAPDKAMLARNIIRLRILSEMERRIRAAAYYDGYLTAAPVGSGPCLVTKCADRGRCPALDKGKLCWSVEVQPAGSGCAYVDYFTLGSKLGWGELQTGGNCAFTEEITNRIGYYNIGLVLID